MRRLVSVLVMVALCVGRLPSPVTAGEATREQLEPGVRVRVKPSKAAASDVSAAAHDGWITGTFLGWQHDTLAVESEDSFERLSVPTRVAREFQVSNGIHGSEAKGAEIGAISGMALGVGFVLVVCGSGECEEAEGSNNYTVFLAIVFGLGGGLVGGGIGALVGSFIDKEEWEDIPLDGVRVGGWSPGPDGVGLAVRFPFGGP